jgi:hypothetical protein
VGLLEPINVGESKKIIIDALGDNEGLKSFCWRIGGERGKLINKKYIREGETNLADM